MTKQYQLIHIDTNEVTMCEKINEHYVSNEEIKEGDWILMFDDFGNLFLGNEPKQYLGEKAGHHLNKGLRKVIATTKTSLECQQVVDYVEELANEYLAIRCHENLNTLEEENLVKEGFFDGFYKHSETHSLSDEECCLFLNWYCDIFLNYLCGLDTDENYEKYKHLKSKGANKEVLEIFKSTLPIKEGYK